uniref:Uncharacterized protein n=1 Tax=Cucumis melo TaxID=3656 RepID=A0A9I9E3G9_CUCME
MGSTVLRTLSLPATAAVAKRRWEAFDNGERTEWCGGVGRLKPRGDPKRRGAAADDGGRGRRRPHGRRWRNRRRCRNEEESDGGRRGNGWFGWRWRGGTEKKKKNFRGG